jgi:hypothetical protein
MFVQGGFSVGGVSRSSLKQRSVLDAIKAEIAVHAAVNASSVFIVSIVEKPVAATRRRVLQVLLSTTFLVIGWFRRRTLYHAHVFTLTIPLPSKWYGVHCQYCCCNYYHWAPLLIVESTSLGFGNVVRMHAAWVITARDSIFLNKTMMYRRTLAVLPSNTL